MCKAFQTLARSVFEVLEHNANWDFSVMKLNDVRLFLPPILAFSTLLFPPSLHVSFPNH